MKLPALLDLFARAVRLRQSVQLTNDDYDVLLALEEGCDLILSVQCHDLLLGGNIVCPGEQHCYSDAFNRVPKPLSAIRDIDDPFILSSQITDESG